MGSGGGHWWALVGNGEQWRWAVIVSNLTTRVSKDRLGQPVHVQPSAAPCGTCECSIRLARMEQGRVKTSSPATVLDSAQPSYCTQHARATQLLYATCFRRLPHPARYSGRYACFRRLPHPARYSSQKARPRRSKQQAATHSPPDRRTHSAGQPPLAPHAAGGQCACRQRCGWGKAGWRVWTGRWEQAGHAASGR